MRKTSLLPGLGPSRKSRCIAACFQGWNLECTHAMNISCSKDLLMNVDVINQCQCMSFEVMYSCHQDRYMSYII